MDAMTTTPAPERTEAPWSPAEARAESAALRRESDAAMSRLKREWATLVAQKQRAEMHRAVLGAVVVVMLPLLIAAVLA